MSNFRCLCNCQNYVASYSVVGSDDLYHESFSFDNFGSHYSHRGVIADKLGVSPDNVSCDLILCERLFSIIRENESSDSPDARLPSLAGAKTLLSVIKSSLS